MKTTKPCLDGELVTHFRCLTYPHQSNSNRNGTTPKAKSESVSPFHRTFYSACPASSTIPCHLCLCPSATKEGPSLPAWLYSYRPGYKVSQKGHRLFLNGLV